MTHVHDEYLYPRETIDATYPRFSMDHNRRVLCQRCVRNCDEIEGAHSRDVVAGIKSLAITDLAQTWGSSESCTSCGKCVDVRPTGALSERQIRCGNDQETSVPPILTNDAKGGGAMEKKKRHGNSAAKEKAPAAKQKVRVATTWLDGCLGCDMAFLDMDEPIADLLNAVDIVYGRTGLHKNISRKGGCGPL